MTSETDTAAYVKAALDRFGGIDVLLANAGIEGQVAPVADYDTEVFRQVLDVNVTGPFLGIKAVYPHMAANGGGSIVLTSSIAGCAARLAWLPTMPASTGHRFDALGGCRGRSHNIRVNTINPSPVEDA